MDEGGDEDHHLHSRHLSKRVRRDKSAVVVFDEAARRDFVTGFHKRKNKRRKIAENQKKVKERQKRLQERKERRMQRRMALGDTPKKNDHEGGDLIEGDEVEEAQKATYTYPFEDVSYEDADLRTIVSTRPIFAEPNVGVASTGNVSQTGPQSEVQMPFTSTKGVHTRRIKKLPIKSKTNHKSSNKRGKSGKARSYASRKHKHPVKKK